jgi:hypothetical protein
MNALRFWARSLTRTRENHASAFVKCAGEIAFRSRREKRVSRHADKIEFVTLFVSFGIHESIGWESQFRESGNADSPN